MSSFAIPSTALFKEQRGSSARKRSYDETDAPVDFDRREFSIRTAGHDPFVPPRIFTPLKLLPRANLPLACLDSGCVGHSIFSSYIRILEEAYEDQDATCVLIAVEKSEARLYAVERVKTQTYALCRLAKWLSRDDIQGMPSSAASSIPQQKRRVVAPIGTTPPWWACAAVEPPLVPASISPSQATFPRLVMLVGPASKVKDTDKSNLSEPLDSRREISSLAKQESPESYNLPASPEDQLQELAKQYLEILYSSRAPLAYFIKGPLSRARAAFIGSGAAPMQIDVLSTFLRDSILSSSTIDKKYRETLPGIVKDALLQGIATPRKPLNLKRKKKWKAKRDKAGLFTAEREYINSWWSSDDSNGSSAESQEAMVKRRCAGIRTRETYLQVILVLEVLALEASAEPLASRATGQAQGADTQREQSQDANAGKKAKSRKEQDLGAVLDASIDKLCIWHSLQANSPAKIEANSTLSSEPTESDELVNFCRDNIVPFFMARIPTVASMVNKKLGGPGAPTPVKHMSTVSRKPGEPAVRPHHEKKPRRSLVRVATEVVEPAPKQVPVLHRSATDIELVPLIKREPSQDTSLSFTTTAGPRQPAPRRRLDLARSISISGREVDFSAISQANEVKLRKKADLKERLRREAKEAIDAIRKPNRQLAVKEYAEEMDLSFAKATARSRPAQKHRPVPVSQVEATPARPRVAYPTPRYERGHGPRPSHLVANAQSTVLGSSEKHRAATGDLLPSSSAVPATGQRQRHGRTDILDTPSRGFAKFMPLGLVHPPGMLESPEILRHGAIQQTPSKPIKQPLFSAKHKATSKGTNADALAVQPKRALAPLRASSPSFGPHEMNEQVAIGEAARTSIYAELGWDEDYEELS